MIARSANPPATASPTAALRPKQARRLRLGHAVAPDIGVPTAHNPVPASQERQQQSPLRPAQGNARSARKRAPPRPMKRARLPTSAQPGVAVRQDPRAARYRVPLSQADWRLRKYQSHLWPSGSALGLRPSTPPPCCARHPPLRQARSPIVTDRRSCGPPLPRWEEQPTPRAQVSIRFVRDCHEGRQATVLVDACAPGVCLASGSRHKSCYP